MNALSKIREPILADLKAVDHLIAQALFSDIPLISEVTQHILQSGGKRMRPLLVLLFAKACGYVSGTLHHELAMMIEFVHTATLLHDDVVDESTLRRGQDTANARWGNQASVLVGDFLYSRSFQILTRAKHLPIMQILANTTNAIAEGEVLQLINRQDTLLTEANYLKVIERKTAKLFEAAAEIGVMLANGSDQEQRAAKTYGLELGLAFQLIDDLLDYTANETELGKHVGDDLAEGKVTLPLIYALKKATAAERQLIETSIQTQTKAHLADILTILQNTHALTLCQEKALHHLSQAKETLLVFKDSPYRQSLYQLIEFNQARTF